MTSDRKKQEEKEKQRNEAQREDAGQRQQDSEVPGQASEQDQGHANTGLRQPFPGAGEASNYE